MPEKKTVQRARKDKRQGKAATTQAGEFVHEEMDHVRKGKHRVSSRKQAIAIGLSKARRSGVKLKPPKAGKASAKTRKGASTKRTTATGRKAAAKKKTSAPRRRQSTRRKAA